MNRWQKIAWYNLIVIAISLTLSGTAIGVLALLVGMPKAIGGLGLLGFLGFLGLSPVLFRKKRGEVDFDERDRLINYRAILGAYSMLWLVLTAACMIPFFIIGPSGSISVCWLPLMLFTISITLTLVHSMGILIQYGRGGEGKKS